ncbi:MAG: SPASM domain-containing protein [Spirochaetia bacterium]|nr:SPASM domain-containing protein [Spirochaetota bacterium]MCX8096982.1 SPASM domain-containing protein [Spirochaetota bacterium]MDW8111935.1 SPASM domain-containing protein [Spirochaetia bacterium]
MLPLVVIKDTDYQNHLFDKLPYQKIFVEPNYESLKASLKDLDRVVVTWNSSAFLDVSIIDRLSKERGEILFIANLPEYMEFEVWDTKLLTEVLEKYKKIDKPLRNILSSTELDESLYFVDILDRDIRMYRWDFDLRTYKGREMFERVVDEIDFSSNVVEQLVSLISSKPFIITEIPSFYYIEISNVKVNTKYTPSWGKEVENITEESFRKIINKVVDYSKTLGVMLGAFNEPIYNPRFNQIIKEILNYKKSEISFILSTSLPELPDTLKEIYSETRDTKGFKGYPFFSIFVDIPSNRKEGFETLKELDYDKVMSNLNELLKIDPTRLYVKFVRSKYNDDILPSFHKEYKNLNLIIQRPQIEEIVAVNTILPYRLPCYKLHTTLVILPNGDVALCLNDTRLDNIIGNVLNEDVKDIANRKADVLKKHFINDFSGICGRCVIWDQFDL